jgi:hypothetical protein
MREMGVIGWRFCRFWVFLPIGHQRIERKNSEKFLEKIEMGVNGIFLPSFFFFFLSTCCCFGLKFPLKDLNGPSKLPSLIENKQKQASHSST